VAAIALALARCARALDAPPALRQKRPDEGVIMGLRIVDAEVQLEQAFAQLEKALTAWAGGKSEAWQKDGRDGPRTEGASYGRREDVYLYTEKTPRTLSVGVALTEKDRALLTLELPRREPAKDRKKFALAIGDAEEPYLLVSVDELRHQGIRDPFKRLAGAPQIKRANVSDRDYVLVGPLTEARAADALLSLAALNPRFEAHVETLGALAASSDEKDDRDVYQVSARVAHERRVHAKVVDGLFEKLRAAGFQIAELKNGPLMADFAVHRADVAIAFEIRADAELEDFLKAIGQLVLIAPAGGAFKRCIVLPAPREALGGALAPFEAAFKEIGALVLLYDFQDKGIKFWAQVVPGDFPQELRALFD
jgi:hypothetical protein